MIVLPKSILDALDAAGFDSPIVTISASYYRRQIGTLIDEVRLSQHNKWLMADTIIEFDANGGPVESYFDDATEWHELADKLWSRIK